MKKLIIAISICAIGLAAEAALSKTSLNIETTKANDLQVSLQSSEDVYGLQFDLTYDPAQLKLTEEKITHMFSGSDVRSNMSVYSKIKEPGLARVIMFDLGGNVIADANNLESILLIDYDVNAVELSSVDASTTVGVTNIILAGAKGSSVPVTHINDRETDDASGEVLLNFGETAPYETSIVGNYPNPFNPSTTIEFDLAKAGFVDVTIYDLQGRKVVNLHSGNLDQSQGHVFNWDANNVASGQYFARITAPGFSDVINMTLLK